MTQDTPASSLLRQTYDQPRITSLLDRQAPVLRTLYLSPQRTTQRTQVFVVILNLS